VWNATRDFTPHEFDLEATQTLHRDYSLAAERMRMDLAGKSLLYSSHPDFSDSLIVDKMKRTRGFPENYSDFLHMVVS
jgi:hypothetical protein